MYIFKCEKSGSLTHGVFEALADFSPLFSEIHALWSLSDRKARGDHSGRKWGLKWFAGWLALQNTNRRLSSILWRFNNLNNYLFLFLKFYIFAKRDYAVYIRKVSLTAVCQCYVCRNLYFSLNQSMIISIREYICGWVLLNMSRWRSSQRHAATLTPSRD